MRRAVTLGRLTVVILTTLPAVAACEAQTPLLEVLLERLGTYLVDYEQKAIELVADEEYDQWVRRRPGYSGGTVQRRKLKSTYFMLRLPSGEAWYGFRDVLSV